MTTVLKLGGSVVTEKADPETVDHDALARAADALAAHAGSADATDPGDVGGLVVVHGGGSFGHHHADRHGVSRDEGTRDPAAVREIHDAMGRLNAAVVGALADASVAAVPVHPLSAARRDAGGNLAMDAGVVAGMLAEGFVPVLHGDVVVHAGRGATILSGDELVAHLAAELDANRIGVCSTVPGVLDGDGSVIGEIRAYDDVAPALGGSEATDVTGGMAAKVQSLLALDAPASIFGLDDLAAFLDGETVGTTVRG